MKRLFSRFTSLSITLIIVTIALSGCGSIKQATKSSTSLSSFLGFSELPDWYIRSKYSYPDSRWITNDFNTEIHYRDVGEGPVIVLLHGEISSLHTWDQWIEILSQNFRVIALDLPGSGLTSAPHCLSNKKKTCTENLSSDYIAHTLEYFIEDLGIEKFSLVGSSYSGYLAAQYAGLQHPEKLDKLVLVTPKGFQQDLPWILNYVTTSGMNVLNKYFQPSTVITEIVDDFYGDSINITTAVTQRYLHLAQSEGGHASNVKQLSLVRALMEHGMLLDLDDIQTPTLVMWGESDKWGDFSHAKRWDEGLPNSTLVSYPFYGHALMEEGAQITVADVAAFINDEAIPTIAGMASEGSSIQDELDSLSQENLFGPADSEEELMEDAE